MELSERILRCKVGMDKYIETIQMVLTKEVVGSFLDRYYVEQANKKKTESMVYHLIRVCEHFIFYMSNKSLIELDWMELCRFQNLKNYQSIPNSELAMLKTVVLDFYRFLAISSPSDSDKVYRSEYEHLLKAHNNCGRGTLKYGQDSVDIGLYIMSNFPVGSNYKFIYQIKCAGTWRNINMNTSNTFLSYILKQFINSFDGHETVGKTHHQLFIFYFEDSLKEFGIVLTNICDFNSRTFKTQYQFYLELGHKYDQYTRDAGIVNVLIRFYNFLDPFIKSQQLDHEVFEDNCGILAKALHSLNFARYYEEGYYFLIHNRFELPHENDKWMLYSYNDVIKSTASNNIVPTSFNFLIIDQSIRKHVKEFLWYHKTQVHTFAPMLYHIAGFLNFKKNYERAMDKVRFIRNVALEEYSFDLGWNYKIDLANRYSAYSTQSYHMSSVRQFIQYLQKKENLKINKKFFDALSVNATRRHDGGTIITEHDYLLIMNEFRLFEQQDIFGELCSIVFVLFATTNLRIGEILNLERVCIQEGSKDESFTAEVAYRTKMSGGEYVYERKSSKVIELIERALNITSPLIDEYAKDILTNFVFVSPTRGRSRSRLKRIDFNNVFRRIVIKLQDKLDNTTYESRNIRHTFIDSVYKEGTQTGLSIREMAQVAGNSYMVANQHYRQNNEVQLYVEIMSKVTISDVDVDGKILRDDKEMDRYSPVKGQLGGCSNEECVNSALECLKCSCFITVLSKIPYFEERIKYYDDKIRASPDAHNREEFVLQKKLHAHYLSAMLKMSVAKEARKRER